jgi:hypothetical protein
MLSLLSFTSTAQNKKVGHLLDGTTIDYVYETVGGVHVELFNGQFHWHWTSGPDKGDTGTAPYQARKLSYKTYLVSFKTSNSSFVTIIFNFEKKLFYTSALLDPKTKTELVLFETGAIKTIKLKES